MFVEGILRYRFTSEVEVLSGDLDDRRTIAAISLNFRRYRAKIQ